MIAEVRKHGGDADECERKIETEANYVSLSMDQRDDRYDG